VHMSAFSIFIEPIFITTMHGKHPYFNFPEIIYLCTLYFILLMYKVTATGGAYKSIVQ
jgi:hypothetical protein